MSEMKITGPNLDVLPSSLTPIINGKHIAKTTGGEIDHIYAPTGKTTTKVPLAGADEIDQAIASAQAALPAWRNMPGTQRAGIMRRFAQIVEENQESLAQLGTLENGTAITTTRANVKSAVKAILYNAGWADKIYGEVIPVEPFQAFHYIINEPYGIVFNILPFNSPVTQFCSISTCALAAGNCVIVKPSSMTPFSSLRYGELLLEAGFPPGVVNIVPTNAQGGALFCKDPRINKIHLTGGVPTARKIMALAAEVITPVGLELGGKSPTVIFGDYDPHDAVEFFIKFIIRNAGQSCSKGSRVLVQSNIYEQVIELAKARVESLSAGDPLLDTTDIGPVVSQTQCDNVMGFIERARESGDARLVSGGFRLGDEYADGFYIAPTIFADVKPESEIFREEVFGPVLTLTKFDTEEEAVQLANQTKFGLAGYVATNDLKRAHRVAAQIEAGYICVNKHGPSIAAPSGGYKESGFGRIGGWAGIREFTHTKNIKISLF